MDFGFTKEQLAFREEVRTYLINELPIDWKGGSYEEFVADDEQWRVFKEMAHKLGDKGWLSLGWPKEYGGQQRSHIDTNIFRYEMMMQGAPGFEGFGINMLGPTLMMFGTDEQKKHYLPRLADGLEIPCFALTEPTAGSDAAANGRPSHVFEAFSRA